MMDLWTYDFMQRALLAGLMVGILCSFVSLFVFLKRLAFVGVGISHAAFGGVALGLFFGWHPLLAGGIFATMVAWGIGYISRRGEIQEDVSIGIFFSTAMALGITVISLAEGYYADLFSFLFGNILAVNSFDLWVLGLWGGLVLLVLSLFFKEMLFICFDEALAQVNGVPVGFLYYLLLTCVAVTVIVVVKTVGIILASALLVIPAATAGELTTHYRAMLIISVATGIMAALGGLGLSCQYNLASGSTIVLFAALLFLLAFVFSPRRRNLAKLIKYFRPRGHQEKIKQQQKQNIPHRH